MLFAKVTWQATDHNETALPYVYEAKASVHFSREKQFLSHCRRLRQERKVCVSVNEAIWLQGLS